MKTLCGGILLLLALPVAAQHEPNMKHPVAASPTPQAMAQHHAFLEEERGAIERGEGFGMALAADRNGYPGPRHVLEMKKELKLTPAQEAAMDKLMADALKAKTHPEIRFEMTSATPRSTNGNAFVLETKGKLTIAGVTRDVAFDVQGSRNADGRYTLVGQAPIKMSDYGIKPPTAMMGTIKTGNDVKVTFRWVVEPAR